MTDRDPSLTPDVPPEGALPVAPALRPERRRAPRLAMLSAFAAQMLGQGGQKRGLKGGQPVLDEAKEAYLEAEWSGPADRRFRTGRLTRTRI